MTEVKGKNRQSRFAVVLGLTLIFSTLASCGIWFFHGKFSVGIMLEEGLDPKFSEIAEDGLGIYGEYFEAHHILERFNSSDVRTNGRYYLSKDFNNASITIPLRHNYSVDAILIITGRPLWNWIDNSGVAWGEANPKSASAVMTVEGYGQRPSRSDHYIKHVALHEILHLLGYLHDVYDEESVMQYAGMGLNFTIGQKVDLPYRTFFAPFFIGNDNWLAIFSINAMISILFLPFPFAFVYLARKGMSRHSRYYALRRDDMVRLARDFCLLFFWMVIAASIVAGILFSLMAIFLFDGLDYCLQEIRRGRRKGLDVKNRITMK